MVRGNCIRLGGTINGDAEYKAGTIKECVNTSVTKVGGYAFYQYQYLVRISFPAAAEIERSAFQACTSLTDVSLENVTAIGVNAFNSCTSLTSIVLPSCVSIGDGAFNYCSNLEAVYLTASSVCQINEGGSVFGGTKITHGGTGRVYVPSALYNDYISAQGWSYYATNNLIVAV